jgi:HEAT repeat protein
MQRGVKTDTASLISAAAKSTDRTARLLAIGILGLREEQTAKPLLRKLLAESGADDLLKREAAMALVRLKDESGLRPLKDLMTCSGEPGRQVYLATFLAYTGDDSGYSYVAKAAVSNNSYVRLSSVGAILEFLSLRSSGRKLTPDPQTLFLTFARDPDPIVRMGVITDSLSALRKGAEIKAIEAMLRRLAKSDIDETIKTGAARTLVYVGQLCTGKGKPAWCE